MAKKKPHHSPFPEMDAIFEGMQDLLSDEEGKPLTPDHPHYHKLTGLMKLMAENMDKTTPGESSTEPQGTA